jgi:O-antigen/teichoic acid export membrane protein
MLTQLRKLAQHSLLYSLVNALTKFINFLLLPLYTGVLTQAEYGVQDLVLTTISLLWIFCMLSMDAAAHRWYWDSEDIVQRKRTISSWTWLLFLLAVFMSGQIWMLSDQLAQWIVDDANAGVFFRIAAIGQFLFSILPNVTWNWLRLQHRPRTLMWFTLLGSFINIGATYIMLVPLNLGIFGLFWAAFISQGTSSLVAIFLLGDWINPRYFMFSRLKEMLRYSLPLVPASLAYWVVSLSDRYFVQAYGNNDDVGVYSVGVRLATVVVLLTMGFQQAWGPLSMSVYLKPEANRIYAMVLLIYTWLGCLLCLGLTLFSPNFVLLATAGGKWIDAAPIIGPMAFSFVMTGLAYIAGLGLEIKKMSVPAATGYIFAALLNIGLNFLLVPRFGKIGSAWATLISQICIPLYLFYKSQQVYPIPYPFKSSVLLFGFAFLLSFGPNFFSVSITTSGTLLKMAIWAGFAMVIFVIRPDLIKQTLQLVRRRT